MSVCEYHAPFLTQDEREAIVEYYTAVPNCLRHTELEELLPGDADAVNAALRERAEQINASHAALIRLLSDPRHLGLKELTWH